ncbi:hypothetical protein [Rhizobium alvei]|uniref:Uncharacterized protein n=1 Tax=Rhizobium alvei TaxID=1132659 RepID=A0ABT8YJ63_9HYPH|nr:hypothetical protein [Rhizobium alvei]MDO6963324.1 hypothetical protein [Rhizobium alvei]
MSFKGLFLVFMAAAGADGSGEMFSIERDLLPFGVPRQFSKRVDSDEPLSEKELRACLAAYASLESTRLELQLDESKLVISELERSAQKMRVHKPVDEIDKQMDAVEEGLTQLQPLLSDEIELFLKKRLGYFADRNAFDQTCASKTYDADMVRKLFPDGIPN